VLHRSRRVLQWHGVHLAARETGGAAPAVRFAGPTARLALPQAHEAGGAVRLGTEHTKFDRHVATRPGYGVATA